MANTLQQRAQQRKLIYIALIPVLFTVSLLHRNFVVYVQANAMQLREIAKGQVELTSSIVRHTLSGAHGLGITVLWAAAIEKQKRHEWNELELLVGSITRLQPYFIIPWRFQGWNLAFNVSVECDAPIDKYYYIARGLTLLAEGEQRNRGTQKKGQVGFPGNPDLRRDIGLFYQLKIGISDDKYTMRSLLDMSCIDPVERRFDLTGLTGDSVTPALREELTKFCHNHPSLSRRIIERIITKNTPSHFIKFLEDNKDGPSRFKMPGPGEKSSKLKEQDKQFPILPRAEDAFWSDPPDPNNSLLTNEAISVYLMSRTWFQYAQQPLPSPDNFYDKVVDPSKRIQQFDQTKHRQARTNDMLFRSDPCRAQYYIAQTLQEEGWFDGEGWQPPVTFLPNVGTVGTLERYRSGPAWHKAYKMYKEFGEQTGIYLTEAQKATLERLDKEFRQQYNLPENENFQTARSDVVNTDGYWAHQALRYYNSNRIILNFDAHLYTAEAEADRETVAGRKLYHEAEKAWLDNRTGYFRLTDQANYLWMHVLLKYPRFAQAKICQEDTYDRQLTYLKRCQEDPEVAPLYTDAILVTFELMPHHYPLGLPWVPQYFNFGLPWATGIQFDSNARQPKRLLTEEQLNKLIPMRTSRGIRTGIRGPFDMLQYYDSPRTKGLKDALCLWTAGAGLCNSPLECLPTALNPGRYMRLLTSSSLGEFTPRKPLPGALPGESWRFLVEEDAITAVRGRRGIR